MEIIRRKISMNKPPQSEIDYYTKALKGNWVYVPAIKIQVGAIYRSFLSGEQKVLIQGLNSPIFRLHDLRHHKQGSKSIELRFAQAQQNLDKFLDYF